MRGCRTGGDLAGRLEPQRELLPRTLLPGRLVPPTRRGALRCGGITYFFLYFGQRCRQIQAVPNRTRCRQSSHIDPHTGPGRSKTGARCNSKKHTDLGSNCNGYAFQSNAPPSSALQLDIQSMTFFGGGGVWGHHPPSDIRSHPQLRLVLSDCSARARVSLCSAPVWPSISVLLALLTCAPLTCLPLSGLQIREPARPPLEQTSPWVSVLRGGNANHPIVGLSY